jgi:glutathione S-transferase
VLPPALSALASLSNALGDKPYLDGEQFTAGDLMMATVLHILGHTDIVTSDHRLVPYLERCTARAHSGGRWLRNWRISGRWRSLKARPHALGSERAFACAKSAPPKCWSG